MSRVTLGASLLVVIVCLSLPNQLRAQSDSSEPEASAPRGGYGGEYGGRGGYGVTGEEAESASRVEDIGVGNPQGKAASEHIESALNEPLKAPIQYEDQPLNEVIDALQDEYEIPILFDHAALEDIAISPDTEITINLRNIKLRSALNLMLRQPGLEDLTYVIEDEVLLITTKEKANARLVVEVYRVDDLIRGFQQPIPGKVSPYSSLTQAITHCVAYDTWMINKSGEGEIALMQPGMLVVTNTRQVHEEVRELLEKLRSARSKIDQDRADAEEGSYGGRGGRGRGYGGSF
jgi:hypothetical protein